MHSGDSVTKVFSVEENLLKLSIEVSRSGAVQDEKVVAQFRKGCQQAEN